MLKGVVISNIVSTRKQDSLVGSKFLEIRLIENGQDTDKFVIAVDSVGAGIGEMFVMLCMYVQQKNSVSISRVLYPRMGVYH